MLRWLLLLLALTFAALGLLTVVKAPDWLAWKLALLAGEFGHYVAFAPLIIFVVAWLMRTKQMPFAIATMFVCALAIGLLLKPAFQAASIAENLPRQLGRAFGPAVAPAHAPFSFFKLFTGGPSPVQSELMPYSGDLRLDFYRPPGVTKPAPCVIVVHGGGWDNGDRGQIASLNDWLAHLGYAVADISYRLAPQDPWPAQFADISAAIAFVKANATKLNVDPTRLVLAGRSAGGQLVEATAYGLHDPAVRGVIALYAPADMHFAWKYARDDDALKSPLLLRQFLGGTPETARVNYDTASGIMLVDKNTPPTLLVHGYLDTLVWYRQSERLAAKLGEAGAQYAFVSLPWATHALEYNLSGPSGQLTAYSMEWFLSAVTK